MVGLSYDAAGNLLHDGTRTLTYDALSRLTSASASGTTPAIAHRRQRARQPDCGGTTTYTPSEYTLLPNQISLWKRQLFDGGAAIFSTTRMQQQRDQATREAALFEQIGRLNMELEWLKKKLADVVEVKRNMIDSMHPTLSICRQYQLLGLNRASFYRTPAQESPFNL